MMIFLVRTIKQIDEKTTMPTDFVIQAESEEDIKYIMNNAKVIVVWLNTVPGRPQSGQIFAQVQQNDILLTCCVAAASIEQACERFVALGLPIIRIQTSHKDISPEQSDQLISYYQNIYANTQPNEEKQKAQEEQKVYQTINSEKQQKIVAVISQTLQDIDAIEKEFTGQNLYRSELHQLHDIKEQLTKMKLWSNMEKSTLILEEAFSLMEKIELSQITMMKQEEQQVMTDSVVSNIDVISELDKFKRAKEVNQAGMSQTASDIYYTFFGISGLYQKFLAKDAMQSLRHLQTSIGNLVSFIHEGITTILLTLSLLIMYSYHSNGIANFPLGELLIQYGIAALISYTLLALRRSNIIILFLALILAIVSVIIIQRLLIANLALM